VRTHPLIQADIEFEAAEPTITEMKFDLLAQLPFKADVIAVADNEHLDQTIGLSRRRR
jgi:hypothetical protein